jgi:hypothetical protein
MAIIESINPQNIYKMFLAFLPGILAFLVYRTLSDRSFGNLDKLDYLLVVFFAILSELSRSVMYPLNIMGWEPGVLTYYLFSGIILGFLGDIAHRLFLEYIVKNYEENVEPKIGNIENTDTGKVTRWSERLREFIPRKKGQMEDANYIEVEVGDDTVSGFLWGFSSDDIELLSYEEFNREVAEREYNPAELVRKTEVITKENVERFRIYDVKLGQIIDLN